MNWLVISLLVSAWYMMGVAIFGALSGVREFIDITTYRAPIRKTLYVIVGLTLWPIMNNAVNGIHWLCFKIERLG